MPKLQNIFKYKQKNASNGNNQQKCKSKNHTNKQIDSTTNNQTQNISLFPIAAQNNPMNSYRPEIKPEQIEERKWRYLSKFMYLASKAHYLLSLKHLTLFLSYSLAEKTIDLVLKQQLTFEYWLLGCLYMPMKYEEIYPPQLLQMRHFLKSNIQVNLYVDAQLKILEYIDLNMNFISLNTYLSQFLHAMNLKQRCSLYYLLEIALSRRHELRKYSLKEIVYSSAFIMTSHRLHLYCNEVIEGISFERIQMCSKFILISKNCVQQKPQFYFNKYANTRYNSVSTGIIPNIQKVTHLFAQKIGMAESESKIVGFLPQPQRQKNNQMIDESEQTIEDIVHKKYPEVKSVKSKH